jgi:hypothetical protein
VRRVGALGDEVFAEVVGRDARRLGHGHLGITSVYLQGIDSGEIIETVHIRPAPIIPVSAALRL